MEILFQSVVLGIVQGLSEFLPISSSGHLIIFPKVFGWSGVVDSLSFDVALHVGTTIAVIWFFWGDWQRILKSFFQGIKKGNITSDFDSKLLFMILVGSIPAGVVGIFFKDWIEQNTREPLLVASTLFIFALILFVADRFGKKRKEFGHINWLEAVLVGVAQALALIPGVSRSGVTISAGLFGGLSREAATRFSFLLSTPAIAGATLLTLGDSANVISSGNNLWVFVIGTIAAAVSGWWAIKFLLKFVSSNNFNIFVGYRIALAILLLLLFL